MPFTVDLTGEAEVTAAGVPNQGDLDGTGTATLTINPGLGQVCWTIDVAGVVGARVWLRGRAPDAAVRFARKLTFTAIGLTHR